VTTAIGGTIRQRSGLSHLYLHLRGMAILCWPTRTSGEDESIPEKRSGRLWSRISSTIH